MLTEVEAEVEATGGAGAAEVGATAVVEATTVVAVLVESAFFRCLHIVVRDNDVEVSSMVTAGAERALDLT